MFTVWKSQAMMVLNPVTPNSGYTAVLQGVVQAVVQAGYKYKVI